MLHHPIQAIIIFLIMSTVHSWSSHIAVIGSGNWGTAIARRVGMNLQDKTTEAPETSVKMWVYEELVHGRRISEIINEDHENPKYLPGVRLPTNVAACTDLLETCRGARVLLFVIPHQFLSNVLEQLAGHIPADAICVSLIKGVTATLCRYSQIIQQQLGVRHIAVMMGANVASDVAQDHFAETTLACLDHSIAHQLATLFDCDTFQVEITNDVATVELLGALKNIIALGAGMCDGLGYGASTKAALIRRGLEEMNAFCKRFTTTYNPHTILGSCGVADVIATCYGGRNRRCAEAFTRHRLQQAAAAAARGGGACSVPKAEELWAKIEADLLDGQKLQGVSTTEEVIAFLDSQPKAKDAQGKEEFSLIRRIHAIAIGGEPVESLLPRKNTVDHQSQIQDI